MAKLNKAQVARLAALHKEIQFYGTAEKGYTDSGFWKFLPYVKTFDTHDEVVRIKGIMDDDKDYLRVVGLFLLACRKSAYTKSRQMRFSWFTTAFALWDTMRLPKQRTLYQSKKEKDAFNMITHGAKNPGAGRADFIMQQLPGWLRDDHVFSGRGNTAGKLSLSPKPQDPSGGRVPWFGSSLEGLPQGADQVRGETISLFLSDESAFQDAFGESLRALLAAVGGGGRYAAVSTVDSGSEFNGLVLDVEGGENAAHEVPEAVQCGLDLMGLKWPKGMRAWKTRSGLDVLETHYSADPDKDPERNPESAAAWISEQLEGYKGGIESSDWLTEMEIVYSAGGGDPVFPNVRITDAIFVDHIDPNWAMDNLRIYAGYDYGTTNPSGYEVCGVDKRERMFGGLWELKEPCTNLTAHCDAIRANPYWRAIEYTMADWSLDNRTQWDDNKLGGVADQFEKCGVILTPGVRGAPVRFAQRLNGEYGWSDPDDADKLMAFVCRDAVGLVNEITQKLRWAKHSSEAVRRRKSNPEKMVDKNDDCFAAWSYLGDVLPPPLLVPGKSKYDGLSIHSIIAAQRMEAARKSVKGGGIRVCP